MRKEFSDSFLDDLEKEKVMQFISDDAMREAVKKILLAGLHQAGVPKKSKPLDTLYNPALIVASSADQTGATDEQIGQSVRAIWAGINAIEAAFESMKNYRPTIERSHKSNPAR